MLYDGGMDPFLIALAGLMGAAGVVLAAAGAHGKPATGLDSAGYLLLIHAVAVIAGTLAARPGPRRRPGAPSSSLPGSLWSRPRAPACAAVDALSRGGEFG